MLLGLVGLSELPELPGESRPLGRGGFVGTKKARWDEKERKEAGRHDICHGSTVTHGGFALPGKAVD